MDWIALFQGGVIGTVITVLVRGYQDKRLEAYKNEILPKSHFRRLLAEKELEFYSQLFEFMPRLRDSVLPYQDWIIRVDPEESEIDRQTKQYLRFMEAYNSLYSACWSQRPFYNTKLWVQIEELLKLSFRLLNRHDRSIAELRHGRRASEDWEKLHNDAKEILSRSGDLVNTIVEHLSSYSDQPGPRRTLIGWINEKRTSLRRSL